MDCWIGIYCRLNCTALLIASSITSYLNWTFNILPAAVHTHMVHCCHSQNCIFETQALSNLHRRKRRPPANICRGSFWPCCPLAFWLVLYFWDTMEPSMEYCLAQVLQKDVGKRLQVGQELIDYFSDKQKSADLEHDQTMLDKMVDGLATSWVNSSNYKVRICHVECDYCQKFQCQVLLELNESCIVDILSYCSVNW